MKKTINILDFISLLIIAVSVVSILMLAFSVFNPIYSLTVGLVISTFILWYCDFTIQKLNLESVLGLLFVVTLAVVFRAEPYHYVIGAQDQGMYVNMAAYYGKHGKPFIIDDVRESLQDESLLEIYDNNMKSNDGGYLPGVYVRSWWEKNVGESEYVFQFYPLHPLWMSVFASLFGDDNGVYSLLFFSLISILAIFGITYELSGNKKTALLAAFFLAINPLHAFISKFPVSEVVALAFSSSGLYYLLKYYNESKKESFNYLHLAISTGLFFCFFFTRIAGFLFLPFFYILLISVIFSKGRQAYALIFYIVAIFVVHFLSVIYGLMYSYPYSISIYNIHFERYLGAQWSEVLLGISIAFLLFPILVALTRNSAIFTFGRNTMSFVNNKFDYAFYAIFILSILKTIQIAFIYDEGDIIGKGWESFPHANIVVVSYYITPIGILLLLFAFRYARKIASAGISFLLVVISLNWIYFCLLIGITVYNYYLARYMSSELLPFSFVLMSLYLGHLITKSKNTKKFSYICVVLMTIYSCYFSLYQLLGREASGAAETLSELSKEINEGDLLLLDGERFRKWREIRTALEFYYDNNVFVISSVTDIEKIMIPVVKRYNDVFLVSQSEIQSNHLNIVNRLTYSEGHFEKSKYIPTKFHTEEFPLFLYKVDKYTLYFNQFNFTKRFTPVEFPTVLSGFHADNMWTTENTSINTFYEKKEGDTYLVIHSKGYNPYLRRKQWEDLNLSVLLNDLELTFSHNEGNSLYYLLPDEKTFQRITIKVNTFVPKELGLNNDTRSLGIDIDYISVH